MKYPSPAELSQYAGRVISEVMSPQGNSATGSAKSGPGEWYTRDCDSDPQYHSRRVVNHALSAVGIGPTGTDAGGESANDHWRRCLVRSVFCCFMAENPPSGEKPVDWRVYGQSKAHL